MDMVGCEMANSTTSHAVFYLNTRSLNSMTEHNKQLPSFKDIVKEMFGIDMVKTTQIIHPLEQIQIAK